MTDLLRLEGDALRAILAEAAGLMSGAYPATSIRMDKAYLAWALQDRPDLGLAAQAALVRQGTELVGFAAATPTAVQVGGVTEPVMLVSFVAVAAAARGRGLGGRLYDALLSALAAQHPAITVLTHAVAGSRGADLIEDRYAHHHWRGHRLEPIHSWGISRRRIAGLGDPDHAEYFANRELRPADDEATPNWLRTDPRCKGKLSAGMRLLAVPLNDERGSVVGAIDTLTGVISAPVLREALHQADARLDATATMIVVNGIPEGAESVADAAGLRRLPAPPWQAWIWSRQLDPRLSAARRSGFPVV